ncbi:MAG: DNA repair protein RecN [Alphaproteobacteria bacterium]|nr:DNA repair protein RecN [Alphaproteobacteria bacterium]
MLSRLSVRNVVLISHLDLEFRSGLTVMTGETGAGKSILLDALGLALGSRADFSLIGRASDRAEVGAMFHVEPGHPVLDILEDAGIASDGEIILRRQLREGKSPALINDTPVSATLLRQVGDNLVEIQGQFEGRGLLDINTHRSLLDRYANAEAQAAATAAAYHNWRELNTRLQSALADLAQARSDEDWLRDAVGQLDDLSPEQGEEDKLTEERGVLSNVSKIADVLAQVEAGLGAEGGAVSIVAAAGKTVDRALETASTILTPLSDALARVDAELDEAVNAITDARDKLDGDPGRLAEVEDRLHALRNQARKHNVTVDELPRIHEELATKLAGLDDQSGGIAELTNAEAEAARVFRDHAIALSETRKAAAQGLDAKVMAELPPLKLESAQFITMIEALPEDKWGPHGMDQIRFEANTNPGMKTGPIDRIASGGELARFLLALKVVLADTSAPMTLIFDEVDSGVGGAVAAAVGDRLSRLGEDTQSIVITHSPQVASRGRYHFRISKSNTDDGMISSAEPLQSDERLEEISRMLSGATITPEARAAALRLMETS